MTELIRSSRLRQLQSASCDPDSTVWSAFAAYGVGEGSSATISASGVTIVESFTVPAACPAP